MTRQFTMLAGAGALALAIVGLAASAGRSADDEKILIPKATADALNKMADEAGKGGDNKKAADEFAKKNPDGLKKIMWAFKPRMANGEGGFGVGKAGTYTPDGIEGLIITNGNPRKPAMKAGDLTKAAPDLERLADLTLAIVDLTHAYTPKKAAPDKNPKDWTKWTDDMKKGAVDLKTAVKKNDPEATKKAFTTLYSSCNSCHTAFRD